jgi:chromosome segregation ATPase
VPSAGFSQGGEGLVSLTVADFENLHEEIRLLRIRIDVMLVENAELRDNSAIEQTWRPEVRALQAEAKRLRSGWSDAEAQIAVLKVQLDEEHQAFLAEQVAGQHSRDEVERLKEELGYCQIQRDDARYGSQQHQAEVARLRAHVKDAETVLELGKAWWLARGHSRAVAEAAFGEAVGSYDPAAYQ